MENVSEYLTTYGYWFLFLYSLGGGFIGLVVASVFAYEGSLNIELVILVAFVSNFLGDNLLVYMAKYQRKDFQVYLQKHTRKIAVCRLWIRKYEYTIMFFQKYIYGIKTVIPIAIGLSNYNLKKFIVLNFFASAIWAIALGYIGYYSSSYILHFFGFFDDKPWLPFVILIALLLGLLSLISKVAQKKMHYKP